MRRSTTPAIRVIQPLCLVTGVFFVTHASARTLSSVFFDALLKYATKLEIYTKIVEIMMNMEKDKRTAAHAFGVFQEVSEAKLDLLRDKPSEGQSATTATRATPFCCSRAADHALGHRECLEEHILEWYNCFECRKNTLLA